MTYFQEQGWNRKMTLDISPQQQQSWLHEIRSLQLTLHRGQDEHLAPVIAKTLLNIMEDLLKSTVETPSTASTRTRTTGTTAQATLLTKLDRMLSR